MEHVSEIIHLHTADVESIYSALTESLKQKNLQARSFIWSKYVLGEWSSVSIDEVCTSCPVCALLLPPKLLQLVCGQAANSTTGIKHVQMTLTTLWKISHNSPKRIWSLNGVQHVLDLPELRIIKPSNTSWLAHESCVKAVKVSSSAFVAALDNIYEQTHEPEALGLSWTLRSRWWLQLCLLHEYTLPQVAKSAKHSRKSTWTFHLHSVLLTPLCTH